MNYRHAFHAGNYCDVLKHAALALALERLRAKEKPFMVLDTHAGRGLYDLDSEAAGRSGEHLGGIARIFGDDAAPPALAPYLDACRRQNPFGALRWYPGSPAIVRDALRPGDGAKFCELHPDERAALQTTMAGDDRIKVFDRDGYQAVRAFLPPPERRGLVLIDPPFEAPGEFDRLADAAADGVARFAAGVFMIWLPLKDEGGYARFLSAVRAIGPGKTLVAELRIAPPDAAKLTGSGLFIINPPFGLGSALEKALPYLAENLGVAPGGGWSLVETEKGATIRKAGGTV
jgi:23S rRNA (adenine2030-N6)-methyltransferase